LLFFCSLKSNSPFGDNTILHIKYYQKVTLPSQTLQEHLV
jgi:hypothetical protein